MPTLNNDLFEGARAAKEEDWSLAFAIASGLER